jgi:hypothetical protein
MRSTSYNNLGECLSSSAIVFKDERRNVEKRLGVSEGVLKRPLSTKTPVSKDFSDHNLDGLTFYGVRFRNCTFRGLAAVSFNSCKFEGCTFDGRRLPQMVFSKLELRSDVVDGVEFFECEFESVLFDGVIFGDIDFVDPTVFRGTKFEDIELRGRFRAVASDPETRKLLGVCASSFRTIPDSHIDFSPVYPAKGILGWEMGRAIMRLPFLSISLYSVSFISLIAILISAIDSAYAGSISERCASVLSRFGLIGHSLLSRCNQLLAVDFGDLFWQDFGFYVASMTAVLAANLIMIAYCPSQVVEYSRSAWTNQLRMPEFTYNVLCNRSPSALYFSLALFAVGILFFLFKIAIAFKNLANL